MGGWAAAIVRWRRPETAGRCRILGVPCPRSVPSERSATTRRPIADLALVVAPPYDVIGAAEHERLLARHPANVVRLDLPAEEPGDEPDDRYRRAARTLAAWRSDGTLRKDPHPSIYVYEQAYRVPGTDVDADQRGFFARLRLEPFGPDSGVLPHERTMSGPKEDRYKLLRATGVNTSPVVGLYDDPAGAARAVLDALTAGAAGRRRRSTTTASRHRLWAVPADGDAAAAVAPLLAAAVARSGDHRRRPPPLRDGAALSRRAPDVALVRGGSGLRLPPDAVPRRDRRAADRAADAPHRSRSR